MTRASLIGRCYRSLAANPHLPKAVETFPLIVERLWDAPKFIAPRGGRYFDRAEMPSDCRQRLPFPIVALEYEASSFIPSPGDGPMPYRVVLAEEIALERRSDGVIARPVTADAVFDDLGVLIISLVSQDGEQWMLWPFSPIMAYADLYRPGDGRPPVPVYWWTWFALDREISDAQKSRDLADEIMAVGTLLAALGCSNVTTELDYRSGADVSVNRKRTRQGKAPLFRYTEVVIPGERRPGGASTGAHASPAWHYRRGHLRRLDAKTVWVRATTVGNPERGVVEHDYVPREKTT